MQELNSPKHDAQWHFHRARKLMKDAKGGIRPPPFNTGQICPVNLRMSGKVFLGHILHFPDGFHPKSEPLVKKITLHKKTIT